MTATRHSPPPGLPAELTAFRSAHASWLEDFALFMTLKEIHGGASWVTWEPELRDRQPKALAAARQQLAAGIDRQVFRQFLFFRQWEKLRRYVHTKGIQIIGDIPIFVAHDSADVWANPEPVLPDQCRSA